MKIDEIREMTVTDLHNRLEELRVELFNLRFQLATGQLDNVMRISEVKRSIARVKTIQRQRELGRLAQEG